MEDNNVVELLAPAGSFNALKAAVESGADAVYLSGNSFGARAYAENFSFDALKAAVTFAHLRNVAVHITVNTIVDNSEFEKLADYLRFLYSINVDAILVQDLGVAYLAKKIIPQMPLHASTQMTVHNLEGVRALEKLGFSRIVLSREVSLNDIRYICANADAEIEIFAHGALCVSYSGQCLMSSMIGGRSGNRGRCAQPCRLPYKLVNQDMKNVLNNSAGEYLLSPRDLNTIDLLPDLIDAGIASLKIEGRMKRSEYVSTVVDVYRKAIDSVENKNFFVSDDDHKKLAQIFNRDFTTAYLEKHQGKVMMSDRRPNNRGLFIGRVTQYDWKSKRVSVKLSEAVNDGDEVNFWVKVGGRIATVLHDMQNRNGTPILSAKSDEIISFPLEKKVHEHDRIFRIFDTKLMKSAQVISNSAYPIRKIPVNVQVIVKIGNPLILKAFSSDGFYSEANSDYIIEPATKSPVTIELLKKQLNRIGNTVYVITDIQIDFSNNAMVPISEINNTRRHLFENLDFVRLNSKKHPPLIEIPLKNVFKLPQKPTLKTPELIVSTDNIDSLKKAISAGAEGVLFGGEAYDSHTTLTLYDYEKAVDCARSFNIPIYFNTPRIINQNSINAFYKLASKLSTLFPDAINIHNIALIEILKEFSNIPLHSDYSLITYNSLTLQMLNELGIKKATLSPELNFEQIKKIVSQSVLPVECIIHGRLELMISEYCVLGSFLGNLGENICNRPCHQSDKYFLQDRKNELFPIITDQFCHMHILNAKTLSMLPYAMYFNELGVDSIRIEARYIPLKEIDTLINAYKEFREYASELSPSKKEKCLKIEGKDITRGHYFRGIL